MSAGLNASQARAKSQQDLIVFDEITAIMRSVIEASASGFFEAVVEDGTTMTESTPTTTITGSVQNPIILSSTTLILNGVTVTLGTSGVGLNAVIADINDAAIPGVVAGKQNGYLTLTFEHEAQTTWTYEIGAGTANNYLGFGQGLYTVASPESVNYYSAWQGIITDRAKVQQMDAIIKHFRNLGYKIDRTTNTTTSRTFKWYLYW